MQGNLMITKIKDLQNVAVPTMDIMVRYIITFPWGENGVGVGGDNIKFIETAML
jgi:hypothetical protein